MILHQLSCPAHHWLFYMKYEFSLNFLHMFYVILHFNITHFWGKISKLDWKKTIGYLICFQWEQKNRKEKKNWRSKDNSAASKIKTER